MPLTSDDLSVWELAHRLADSDPYKRYWFGVPLSVRDNIQLLVNEIWSAHLDSSLIMEKRRADSDLPSEFYIRQHLDTISDCVRGRGIPRRFLEFVMIERWDFWRWCQQSGHGLPDFWFGVDYQWPDGGDSEEPSKELDPDSPRGELARLREQCRDIARDIWAEDSQLPQAQVAKRIRESGIGVNYEEDTVKRWIRPVAPESVKGRPGRPKKS